MQDLQDLEMQPSQQMRTEEPEQEVNANELEWLSNPSSFYEESIDPPWLQKGHIKGASDRSLCK